MKSDFESIKKINTVAEETPDYFRLLIMPTFQTFQWKLFSEPRLNNSIRRYHSPLPKSETNFDKNNQFKGGESSVDKKCRDFDIENPVSFTSSSYTISILYYD